MDVLSLFAYVKFEPDTRRLGTFTVMATHSEAFLRYVAFCICTAECFRWRHSDIVWS